MGTLYQPFPSHHSYTSSATMPYKDIKLNDGRKIPQIGFGTWKIPKETTVDNVDLAIETGFSHIDTAQIYGNEEEVGQALKQSGLSRKEIWVTTKWSGRPWGNGGSISAVDSMKQSLEKLQLDSVDLYLIHTPRLIEGNIRAGWQDIIDLQKQGHAKSIGVSNFKLEDMKELLEGEKGPEVVPVVNQIEVHPYVWKEMKPLVEYCQANGVAIEAYSPLKPLTTYPSGPVSKSVNAIAERLDVKPEEVLLAWVKSKGAIILTTSTKKERLEAYLAAGDVELTDDDIAAIEKAGEKSPGNFWASAGRIAGFTLLQLCAYYNLKRFWGSA